MHARRNGHEVTAQALATIAGKSTFDQASSAMHPGENAAKSEGNLDGGFIAKSRNWILGSGLASAGTGLALIAANVINPLSWGAAALVGGGVGAVLVARKVKQMVTQYWEKQTQAVLDRHGPMSHESAKEIVNSGRGWRIAGPLIAVGGTFAAAALMPVFGPAALGLAIPALLSGAYASAKGKVVAEAAKRLGMPSRGSPTLWITIYL